MLRFSLKRYCARKDKLDFEMLQLPAIAAKLSIVLHFSAKVKQLTHKHNLSLNTI